MKIIITVTGLLFVGLELGLVLGGEVFSELKSSTGKEELPKLRALPTVGNARDGLTLHCLCICCDVSRNLAP